MWIFFYGGRCASMIILNIIAPFQTQRSVMIMEIEEKIQSEVLQCVVFSPFRFITDEAELVSSLFEAGLDYYHFRKSDTDREKVQRFFSKIDPRWYPRIVIHHDFSILDSLPFSTIHVSSNKKNSLLYRLFVLDRLRRKHSQLQLVTTYEDINTFHVRPGVYKYVLLNGVFTKVAFDLAALAYVKATLEKRLKHIPVPVFAKGMMTKESVVQARSLGFSGIALQEDFWAHPDPLAYFELIKTWRA